jgi:hypothetical protein
MEADQLHRLLRSFSGNPDYLTEDRVLADEISTKINNALVLNGE